ncbi:MAG TPA: hypothetical protein VLT35_00080, partial [Methanocella sp.]|nr:hypothetical protein [Methanocella sp.]
QAAIAGLEEFVASFRFNADRLVAYQYYFHLKQSFPEAYEKGDNVAEPATESLPLPATSRAYPVPDGHTEDDVIIFEKGSGCLEVIGSHGELEAYLGKVKRLGPYPAIARLMETYVLGEDQEPGPLIENCGRLLSSPGIEPDIRTITDLIRDVAEGAVGSGGTVILYSDRLE